MSPQTAGGDPLTTPAVKTRPIHIECEGDRLLGMLTLPAGRAVEKALLVVTGGPQYRVGSHRLFLQIGRWLAADGIAVLRFDFRGAGDSTGQPRPFTDHQADIAAALQALRAELGNSLVDIGLFGLCDGASAALMFFHEHTSANIHRLVLLNPWVHSPETHARVQLKHYYRQRLFSTDFWHRLIAGKVGPGAVSGVLKQATKMFRSKSINPAGKGLHHCIHGSNQNNAHTSFQDRMKLGLLAFNGKVCMIFSEHDFTAAEFREACISDSKWQAALQRHGVQTHTVDGADHTFSSDTTKLVLREILLDFFSSSFRGSQSTDFASSCCASKKNQDLPKLV